MHLLRGLGCSAESDDDVACDAFAAEVVAFNDGRTVSTTGAEDAAGTVVSP